MKVLGISAGRHNGNSDIAVKEALLACQEKGAEVVFINLFDCRSKYSVFENSGSFIGISKTYLLSCIPLQK